MGDKRRRIKYVARMSDATWESGLCGCCDVKDCGIGCCCKLYCGGPCVFGSAMEKAGLGSCAGCCCALACFPVCTLCNARVEVAKKYGIKEGGMGACVQSCCCPSCTAIQIINQILVKENATLGCCGVEASAGAPENQEMNR